jgi:hypothetical protein
MVQLAPEVYNDLEQFRLKEETFSSAVFRLLCMHYQMRTMLKDLAGQKEEEE